MAIPDYYIHQQARAYIEAHGDDAAAKARERTADLEARGDRIGADMWTRVVTVIEEMQGAA